MGIRKAMSKATITLRRSADRGHANHGWLNTFHTFSFANYQDPNYMHWGSIRVLNEDRVAPQSGFPTHPHRDAEIFSYILSGQLTHRDSMLSSSSSSTISPTATQSSKNKDDFYRMHRGDIQFTTGGTGISHSETNESPDQTVHFLQIWALPWKRSLKPRYHTRSFQDEDKRQRFVDCLTPLKGGIDATSVQEEDAEGSVGNTIPVHADLAMGAGIIGAERMFTWSVGSEGRGLLSSSGRHVYVHLPMTKEGRAKIRLDGRADTILHEGDGAFVRADRGFELQVENVGDVEAEVVVLDSD